MLSWYISPFPPAHRETWLLTENDETEEVKLQMDSHQHESPELDALWCTTYCLWSIRRECMFLLVSGWLFTALACQFYSSMAMSVSVFICPLFFFLSLSPSPSPTLSLFLWLLLSVLKYVYFKKDKFMFWDHLSWQLFFNDENCHIRQ